MRFGPRFVFIGSGLVQVWFRFGSGFACLVQVWFSVGAGFAQVVHAWVVAGSADGLGWVLGWLGFSVIAAGCVLELLLLYAALDSGDCICLNL